MLDILFLFDFQMIIGIMVQDMYAYHHPAFARETRIQKRGDFMKIEMCIRDRYRSLHADVDYVVDTCIFNAYRS